jgi:hypothetical protein
VNKRLGKKEKRDISTLARFVTLYCRSHHEERTPFEFKAPGLENLFKKPFELCAECAKLLKYGLTMRLLCPQEPKPMCKKCPDPCYRPEYRDKIREVMRFSGIYLVKRGRVDLMYHYFR